MTNTIQLFCSSCGYKFNHSPDFKGKLTGITGGAVSGALLGAKVGIAAGPLGAIAGTIPGAVLGVIFGKDFGNKFDRPICPSCKNSFEIPSNLKESFLNSILKNDNIEKNKIKSNSEIGKKNVSEEYKRIKSKIDSNKSAYKETFLGGMPNYGNMSVEEINKLKEELYKTDNINNKKHFK